MEFIRQKVFRWMILIVFAILTGFFGMQYLVQSFELVGIYGILLTITVGGIVFVIGKAFRGRTLALAAILTLIGMLTGY